MDRRLALLLLALVLLPIAAVPGDADEERRDGPLTTRIYEIGALTHGVQDFLRPVSPPEFRGLGDEDYPLFGADVEEPRYPFGMADELVELIRMNVDPGMWEATEGADILTLGEQRVLVRCPREHHDRIGAYLTTLEHAALTPHTIDVRVVPASHAGGEEQGAALAAVAVSALPRQRAVAWDGFQHAYVCDYDVEVAKGAAISDPIVLVANIGLIVQARVLPGPEGGELRIEVNAAYTELVSTDLASVGEERIVEKPTCRTFRAFTDTIVKPGVWTPLTTSTHVDGSRIAYEVRVTPHDVPLRPTSPDHAFLDPDAFDDSGKMTTRMIDVGRLTAPAAHARGRAPWAVWPSNYVLPEPPELPEPAPLYPASALPDTLMTIMGENGAWEQGYVELRGGRLIMRNTPPVLAAAEGIIDKLRRASIRTVTVHAELVETSAEAAGWLVERGSFAPDERTKAFAGARAATVFDSRIVCPKDARRNTAAGTEFTYVGDYEVEIAEDSAIANPIMHFVFEGTQIEVQPRLGSTETATLLQVDYVRTRRRQKEKWADTPHGRLDTPQLDTTQLRATLFVPLGRTVVAGVFGAGPTRRVLLLTPTLQRATR